jgi:uracil-DNA glycosylase family 4
VCTELYIFKSSTEPLIFITLSIWESYRNKHEDCDVCAKSGLREEGAKPLFSNSMATNTDLLFVMEAPNHDDTFDINKGYITIDPDTDQSGEFLFRLYTKTLQRKMKDLSITNSVLCLPKKCRSGYKVTNEQKINCLPKLKSLIDMLNPMVVCSIGLEALKSMERIEKHNLLSMKMAVGKRIDWYDRILFPLYHTSRQVRNLPNGRSEQEQISDWNNLSFLLEKISQKRIDHRP